jgi:uncharacterized membrane protein
MDNKAIRLEARTLLAGKWGKLALVWLILYAIDIVISSLSNWTFILTLLIAGPFTLGIYTIFLKIFRREDFKIEEMFNGFKDFGRALGTYLLMTLYILLWSILLIVPGIIAAISYSMTFFILAENPNIKAADALRLSKQMMYGHKTQYFMLMLSFIGWFLLSILTFGIGLLFLYSYITMASTIFYQQIKGEALYNEIIIENVEQSTKSPTKDSDESTNQDSTYPDLY